MYIFIHLVQCSGGIDASFAVETKQLCNVFATARARAMQPTRATVARRLASRKIDRPFQAAVSCFHLTYQYSYFYMVVCIVFALMCLYIPQII